MEIQIKVEKVLEPVLFQKKDGNRGSRWGFIGVTMEQYPKKICFDVLGDETKWRSFGIVVGNIYNVSFDLSSREFNGKWYTSVNCWKVVIPSVGYMPQYMPQQPQPYQSNTSVNQQTSIESDNNLPY